MGDKFTVPIRARFVVLLSCEIMLPGNNRLVILSATILLWCHLYLEYCEGFKLEKTMQLINNIESIDPDIINFFSRKTPASVYRNDISEMDLSEMDTNDLMNCFRTLSYICFQKKILLFVDALNNIDRINMFGGYISFLRIGKPYVKPPITDDILGSRGVVDSNSLSASLAKAFDHFVDHRVVRITLPGINTNLVGRSFPDRSHCFEFSFSDNPVAAKNENYTLGGEEKGRLQSDQSCARGDSGMMALSSALIVKMIMLVPTLLKVIAAKAFFGILMGLISVILSKMALLPYFLSPPKGYHHHHHHGSSFRQHQPPVVVTPTPSATLVADNYMGYYPNIESNVIPATAIAGSSGSSFTGPTAIMGPTGPHHYDSVWGDHNEIHEDDGNVIYSSPIKRSGESYGSINKAEKQTTDDHYTQLNFGALKTRRVHPTYGNVISSRNSESSDTPAIDISPTMMFDMTTAVSSTTSSWVPSNNIPGRMKRWYDWFKP